MKLEQLEIIAQNTIYQKPTTNKWNDEDYINAAISITLKNEILLKALHILMRRFPPIKYVYKLSLKSYINEMKEYNNSTQLSSH